MKNTLHGIAVLAKHGAKDKYSLVICSIDMIVLEITTLFVR